EQVHVRRGTDDSHGGGAIAGQVGAAARYWVVVGVGRDAEEHRSQRDDAGRVRTGRVGGAEGNAAGVGAVGVLVIVVVDLQLEVRVVENHPDVRIHHLVRAARRPPRHVG